MASTPGVGPVVKSPPANAGGCKGHGFNPWVGRAPWRRARQPSRYSCLENPADRGAWRAAAMGSHRVWPDCRDSARERSSGPLPATAPLCGCEPPALCDPVDCGLPDAPAQSGCHSLLQGIFLTQRSNLPHLPVPASAGGLFTTAPPGKYLCAQMLRGKLPPSVACKCLKGGHCSLHFSSEPPLTRTISGLDIRMLN